MSKETTQPTRINKSEYIKFKQWVQDVHGTTKGHLKTEIENALREYRQPNNGNEQLDRIENDMATIKAVLADAHTDGGDMVDTLESQNTHAHAENGKPNTNAPRDEKVQWVITEYYNANGGSTTPRAIKSQLQEAYSFGERTTDKYVDLVLDELSAEPDPRTDNDLYVWGKKLESAREEVKRKAEEEANRQMEELEQ